MSDEQTGARAADVRRRRRADRLAAITERPEIAAEPSAAPPAPDHPTRGESAPQPPRAPAPQRPDGVVLVDAAEYARLRDAAAEPERLAAELARERREQLVMAAIRDGRIPPARRAHWLQHLEVDHEGATTALAALPPGLIPVGDPIGHDAPEPARNDDSWFPGQ